MKLSNFAKIALILVPTVLSACGDPNVGPASVCQTTPYKAQPIQGGTFTMGTPQRYPEEVERNATVSNFDIDSHEVTNAQFRAFVNDTAYITTAEKPQLGFDAPGAAIFTPPDTANPSWWRFMEGANWKHPEGPNSHIDGQDNYPVVQVSFDDALAYANWAKRDLPTEAEWEYAAKANSETRYVWGDARTPDGKEMANTWQGAFPIENTNSDGFGFRAPVGCFPANDFGLHDMIGNVWEWTKSEPRQTSNTPTYTIKGGSYLCAENYCARYRSAARQFQEADLPTNHIGFRTVSRPKSQ